GSEGPSIQIGATTAKGACRVLKCRMAWTRYIMSAGAGTGLAVAFNAPLTGIIFVIEEVQKKVTPMLLLTAGCSVTIGVLTSNV
ncbi:MAG TPA: chloride channel protein, partial [Clostridia bacterium]|nr:chloride channel protein [Clostridia bacterium]